ncbi:MAG: hypothetical protein NZ927_04505 [Candidatus Calescibacterium sp.]|nr:hypothetical protein [Candidatus Calescibacterium sp.]
MVNGEAERKKDVSTIVISAITFILGLIIGILLSRCPSKKEEGKISEKSFPERPTTEVIQQERVKVFIEGKPAQEFFQTHITMYKAEVTTFPVPPTCSIPKFSPVILEAPRKYTNRKMVDIIFSPGLVFTCKTEGFEFPCGVNSNRISVEYLEDGLKNFEVKYKDEIGCEVDLIKISFIVDTTPPETKIVPVGFSEMVTSPEARFKLDVSEPYRVLLCRVDDGFWMDCSGSSINLSNLEEGWHKISAYSIDLAGNEERQIKEYIFRVDARPPVSFLISAPSAITNSHEAVFEFDADEDDVRFECSLNDSGWFACSSPYKISNMKAGLYKFKLRSIDFMNRIEQDPVVYSWSVVEGEIRGNIKPFIPPREIKKIRKYKKEEQSVDNKKEVNM